MPEQQQQQLITQQTHVSQYRQYVDQQRTVAKRTQEQLKQQNRTQQYSYVNRVTAYYQQQPATRTSGCNYYNDPYFYSAPIYRYQRQGQYYQLNQYGADLLRQAVNYGYDEGYRSGRADRMDHWRADYRNSYAYQNASYGYSGYYLDRREYAYYFRQGFQRGYDDGYYSRYQYGRYNNGGYSMMGNMLSVILNLQSY